MADPRTTVWGKQVGPTVVGQDIYEESSTPKCRIGLLLQLGDRFFRYAKNGAVALAKGKMTQGAVAIANHRNIVVAAAAPAATTTVTVTLGATAVVANQYADGYLHVNNEAGEGVTYRIKSHPAAAASANLVVTLYDALETALTTTSRVTLTKGKYDSVVIAPAAGLTSAATGVPLINVAAGNFFWMQTKGPAAVLTQGTIVIGQNVGLGGTVDGACGPVGAVTTDVWGRVLQVNASTDYSLIDLSLE